MTVILLITHIVLDTAALAWGYQSAGFSSISLGSLALGVLWLIATWRKKGWAAAVGLFATVVAAGLGVLVGVPPGWMLAATLFALIAWDLTRFRERLTLAFFEDDLAGLERRHLLRLSILAMTALLLSSIPMVITLKISFEWILLLAMVSAIGIAQIVRWIKSTK